MLLSASHEFLPRTPTSNAAVVMDHFGIGFEVGRHVVAEPFELPIEPGQVVCFTGGSGSGKSTLLRAAAAQLEGTLALDSLELGERILIDAIPWPPQESLPLLAACGLGEARLLLRTPRELSDGQRFRFRLALALSRRPRWIVIDEFTATLDRTLAKIIAFNVRRMAERTGTGFLLATTHEDVLEDLAADLHVECRIDAPPVVHSGRRRNREISVVGAVDVQSQSPNLTISATKVKKKAPTVAARPARDHDRGEG